MTIPRENLIALEQICSHHHIEDSFVHSLQKTGLLGLVKIENTFFIDQSQLSQLEKYIEFHYTLDINLEGIETIDHLLHHIHSLQAELTLLKSRLQFYEPLP